MMAAKMKGKELSSSKLQIQAPHFFKIVLLPSDQGLRIPDAFMRIHGESLQDTVLLKVPNGASWKVELVHYDGNRTWLKKGWKEFAEHYSIKCFYFLVFRYDGNSEFYVIIFNVTATEIKYPSEANCDKSDEFLISPLAGQRSSCVKTEVNLDQDDEDEKEAEEIVVETLETYPKTHASEGKRARVEDIEDDVSIEILEDLSDFKPRPRTRVRHNLLTENQPTNSSGNKKAKPNQDEEDVSIEISVDTSDSEFKPRLRPRTRACHNLSTENQSTKSSGNVKNGKGKPNQDENSEAEEESSLETKMPYTEYRKGNGKTKCQSYQKAKAFQSSKPFFICFMYPSYVHGKSPMEIPSNFVRDYFPMEGKYEFNLQVSGRPKKWFVIFRIYSGRAKILGPGWRKFVQDNSIKMSYSCVFELEPGTNSFNVTIYR